MHALRSCIFYLSTLTSSSQHNERIVTRAKSRSIRDMISSITVALHRIPGYHDAAMTHHIRHPGRGVLMPYTVSAFRGAEHTYIHICREYGTSHYPCEMRSYVNNTTSGISHLQCLHNVVWAINGFQKCIVSIENMNKQVL